MVLGKLDRYLQKNETGPPSYTTHKDKFKMDLSVRPKTIKIIEETLAAKPWTLLVAIFYWIYLPRQGKQKKIINKWDCMKLKSFCTGKEIIKKIKRQPTEWENIFANTSDKGLISTIYKELTKLNTHTHKKPQKPQPIEKWT